jgi:hypothetical protein
LNPVVSNSDGPKIKSPNRVISSINTKISVICRQIRALLLKRNDSLSSFVTDLRKLRAFRYEDVDMIKNPRERKDNIIK